MGASELDEISKKTAIYEASIVPIIAVATSCRELQNMRQYCHSGKFMSINRHRVAASMVLYLSVTAKFETIKIRVFNS
jgi:hypothetical protein